MEQIYGGEKLAKKRSCAKCHTSKPVETFNELIPGDHISMNGAMLTKTKTPNIAKRYYTHHAIVDEVKHTTDDGKGAIIQIYHVMPPDQDSAMKLNAEGASNREMCPATEGSDSSSEVSDNHGSKCVRKEQQALDIKTNRIKKISYNDAFYEKDEIRIRAEKCYTKGIAKISDEYMIMTNNCEHFCHFCSTGHRYSNQASRLSNGCRYAFESVCFTNSKFLRYLLKILILSTDDFIADVYTTGGVLAFLLVVNLLLVILLNNHCAFFFCYSSKECCCCVHSSNCCTNYPLCICLKCSCCHEYSSLNCSRCCRVSCCQLKKDEKWYCKICHHKKKCLRWYKFLVTLVCQVVGYALMVFMINENISIGIIIGSGVGISSLNIILYISLPPCFFRICCCKKCPC